MKQLKLIIDERGKEILKDRTALEEAMRQGGCDEREIHTILLILTSCPAVATQLVRQEPSRREVDVMVNSCCASTGLHAHAVRKGLGMLLQACGYETHSPSLTVWRMQSQGLELVPENSLEDQTVMELADRLRDEEDDSAALSDLHTLAEAGNAKAAYTLGCFFKQRDDAEGTRNGMPYFEKAAQLGFGPAYGALAHYHMYGGKRNLAKAAECFSNPASLYGREGRQWKLLSQYLHQYHVDNKKRLRTNTILQAVVLAVTVALVALSGSFGFWTILALSIQALAFGWTLFCLILRPYQTSRIGNYAMMLSWLLLAVCIL